MHTLSIRITERRGDTERTIDIGSLAQAPALETIEMPSVLDTRAAPAAGERFTRVAADGSTLPPGSTGEHVAVIDQTTGLMWSVESLGDPAEPDDGITQEHCIERCRQLRLLGHEDWRLPTRAELAGLIDDTRHEPAIDTAAFPRVKSRWHWTSTPAAWSSSAAWGVYFSLGYVGYDRRLSVGFALAVRRSGQ